jgi:MFS family permease
MAVSRALIDVAPLRSSPRFRRLWIGRTFSGFDRSDRRRFYLIATTGQAGCSALLALQGFLGHLPVTGVLLLVAAQSCFVAGGGPASRTFISRLLSNAQLAAGLALNRIAFQAAMLLGPALGGLVLGWRGVGGCYLIDTITFAVAFYGAFGLPPMRPEGERSGPGLHGVLELEGLRFLAGNPTPLTHCSAGWPPPSRSSARPDRTSATCAAA